MLWTILVASVVSGIAALVSLILIWRSSRGDGHSVREELRAGREESRSAGKELREEVVASLKTSADTIAGALESVAKAQQSKLEDMTRQLKDLSESSQSALERIRSTIDTRVKELQEGNEKILGASRKEVSDGLKATSEAIEKALGELEKVQQTKLDGMTNQLKEHTESNQSALERVRNTIDVRVKELQEGNEKSLGEFRRQATEAQKAATEALSKALESMGNAQQTKLEGMSVQLKELTESNHTSLDRIRNTFDVRVRELQEGNEKKLDEMRKTVDDKLHDTLEKRLGESFKLVSDRLESVHKGLGEMQTLASGVGDLKRVLTNVKARGTWAEVQLGALLDQVLSPEQYQKNVCVKTETSERVEFAIQLPGPRNDPGSRVWLPIDSKFPQEDYLRLQAAAETADAAAVQSATDALARTVRIAAKDIFDKYVDPPNTTDFAIMFLATEGLYAEVLRQPDLVTDLQQKYRVVLAGPTTLVAILSSLRMGFQTLAIEQRASEVWRVLGAVKAEFGKFGDVLDKVKKQLNTASRTIDETGVRSRALERKLKTVETLSDDDAVKVLALSDQTAPSLDDMVDVEPEDDIEVTGGA